MRINYGNEKYKNRLLDFYRWVYAECKCRDIKQKNIAEVCNQSESNFSKRLRSGNIKLVDFFRIVDELEATDNDILKIVKG